MKNPFQASPPPPLAAAAAGATSGSVSTTVPTKNTVSANLTLFRQNAEPLDLQDVAEDERVKASRSGGHEKSRHSNNSDDSNDHQPPKENPCKYLTKEQREAVIENLEIEMADRLMRLRKQVDVLKQNLVFRGEIEIDRIPSSVRPLTMEEFWLKFNGDANAYRQRQAQLKADVQNSVLQLMGVHVDRASSSTLSSTSSLNAISRKRQRLEL
ncbi:hypothetical protein DFQ26_004083 [Actinomortierella ambigua]|nr:hypothetical protein DFQ26_004083 [Actinomortierella ambigua]